MILLNEHAKYKVIKSKKEYFWNLINEIAEQFKTSDNFAPYWQLEEKMPELENIKDYIHDTILVQLHNRNKIVKNISLEEKVIMWLIGVGGWGKNKIKLWKEYNGTFQDWFYNEDLTVYRGKPTYDNENLEYHLHVVEKTYKSFTLDINTAINFTQPGWANRAFKDDEKRNGIVLEGKIKPCDVHIFNNEGFEYEVIIKGPYTCDQYHIVKNGILIK